MIFLGYRETGVVPVSRLALAALGAREMAMAAAGTPPATRMCLPAFVRSDRLAAQQRGRLATMGGRVRHPIILTLVMFPVLMLNDLLLAHHDENQARHKFGDTRARYESHVLGWFPGHGRRGLTTGSA